MHAEDRGAKKRMANRKEVITMEAGDRTGPRGMGLMGGKAAGYCTEQQGPGCSGPGNDSGVGRGHGRRLGRGRGRCFRGGITGISNAAPTATREQELETLKQQADYFKTAGEEISARIKELDLPPKGD
jgi:hypothetical protein